MKIVRFAEAAFWWLVLLVTLFIVDDLIYGPFFWAIAIWSQPLSTVFAFVASVTMQLWLVRSLSRPMPSRPAQWVLSRLQVERAHEHLRVREDSIRRRVVSYGGAIVATLLVGAVLTTITLRKHREVGWRFIVVAVLLYATEFALIHGGYGLGWMGHWVGQWFGL